MSLFDGEEYKRRLYAYAHPAADRERVEELVDAFRNVEALNAIICLNYTPLCPPHMVYIIRRPLELDESPVPVADA